MGLDIYFCGFKHSEVRYPFLPGKRRTCTSKQVRTSERARGGMLAGRKNAICSIDGNEGEVGIQNRASASLRVRRKSEKTPLLMFHGER